MNKQVAKWCIDLAMGIAFLFCSGTGIVKFLFLLRAAETTGLILPMAQLSDIHDRAGIFLAFLVALHLFVNRAWIISMTKRVLSGEAGDG